MSGTGVWLVGARGNVATTAIVGARAIVQGETDTTGMVTGRPPCTRLDLPSVDEFVFGGHDIQLRSIFSTAQELSESGTPAPAIVEAVADDLQRIDDRIQVGTARNCGQAVDQLADKTLTDQSVANTINQIRSDFQSFVTKHDLHRLVVVNLASTEPALTESDQYETLAAFENALDAGDTDLPASSLYAYAAIDEGHPYINFTPSTGSALGGLIELANQRGVPHMGRDAKTGETLVKSALAPMFTMRNLRVRSWEGHNILGNADGQVLEDEANKAGKLASKSGVLDDILDDDLHNRVRIDYTPPLGDWKTAWDDIRFDGFLDTRMKMQFTWEGSDSALAAPLVLDLVRLLAYADACGESGLQPQLASFFKDPLQVEGHNLSQQFDRLRSYVRRHVEAEV